MMLSNQRRSARRAGDGAVKQEPSAQELHAHSGVNKDDYSTATFAPPNHPTTNGYAAGPVSPGQTAHHLLAHGYGQTAIPDHELRIDPDLRSSTEPSPNSSYAPVPNMMPAAMPQSSEQVPIMSGPHTNVGPSAVGAMDAEDTSPDGRKAKRELSQSKRAAQNRAAQRAFRQRKEGYIKKLEQQVREYAEMESSYKAIQTENYSLRDYVIHLQSRLLDTQGEYPPPPPNVNLAQPHQHSHAPAPAAPQPISSASEVPQPAPGSATSLQVVAEAVAGLTRGDHLSEREPYPGAKAFKPEQPGRSVEDDARAAEEISRQLQAESNPEGMPQAPM